MLETRQVDKLRDSGYQIYVYIIIASGYMWRVAIRRLCLFVSRELMRKNERNLGILEFWRAFFLLFGLGENNGLRHCLKIKYT